MQFVVSIRKLELVKVCRLSFYMMMMLMRSVVRSVVNCVMHDNSPHQTRHHRGKYIEAVLHFHFYVEF